MAVASRWRSVDTAIIRCKTPRHACEVNEGSFACLEFVDCVDIAFPLLRHDYDLGHCFSALSYQSRQAESTIEHWATCFIIYW